MRAERVSECHGAAIDVGALAIETELLLDGQVLGSEGLVDLDEVHVIQPQAGPVERAP